MNGVITGVLDDALSKLTEYCSRDETKQAFESRIVAPMVSYVADKFAWGVRLFQIVAMLVLVQTVLLLWLLLRDLRR